jgi:hypothetical protein
LFILVLEQSNMPLQQPNSPSLDDTMGPEDIDLPHGESMDLETVVDLFPFIDTSFNDLPNELGFQNPQLQLQMPHEAESQLEFSTEVAGASARSISDVSLR